MGWLKDNPDEALPQVLYDGFVNVEGAVFMPSVWLALGNIGTSAILQQHFLSFVMKFKGASRSALKICSQYGWTSKLSSFDTWLDITERATAETVRCVFCHIFSFRFLQFRNVQVVAISQLCSQLFYFSYSGE
jgi:hypothetical protein